MIRYTLILLFTALITSVAVKAQPGPDSTIVQDSFEWAPKKWSLLFSLGPVRRSLLAYSPPEFMSGGALGLDYEKSIRSNLYWTTEFFTEMSWLETERLQSQASSANPTHVSVNAKILESDKFWQFGLSGGLSGDLLSSKRMRMNWGLGLGLVYQTYPNITVEYTPSFPDLSDTQFVNIVTFTKPGILSALFTFRGTIDYNLSEKWAVSLIGRFRIFPNESIFSTSVSRTGSSYLINNFSARGNVVYFGIGLRRVQ